MRQRSDGDQLGFRFVGGRPCLDLTATAGERWRQRIERLRTPPDLARRFVRAGAAGARWPPAAPAPR